MLRRQKKLGGCFALFFMVLMMCSVNVHAQGTSSIRISNSAPAEGEAVSVQVLASESGSVTVKYNPEVLNLTGCSQNYTTDGNTITFEGTDATLSFTAVKAGKSSVIVSGTNVEGSSASIQVSGSNSASQTDSAGQQNQDAEGQFTVDGVAYVVSERFSDAEIPAGFERTREQIDGYNYKVLTDGSRILVYLKPASDTSSKGTFYVYDKETHSVSSFEALQGEESYVLIQKPETVIGNATETKLEVNGQQITAYVIGDNSEFYLIYGTDNSGETGWFQYDTKEGTIQRMNEALLSSASQESTEAETDESGQTENYQAKWSKLRYIVAVLIFVIVVLAVISVNLFLSKRRLSEDDQEDDYDDDYEQDNEEEDIAESDLDEQEPEESFTDSKVSYEDVRGTEAFRSSREIRHKTSDDDHVDIIDLNDL